MSTFLLQVGKGVHFRALQSDMESIGALGDGLGLTVGGAEAEGLHLRRANASAPALCQNKLPKFGPFFC